MTYVSVLCVLGSADDLDGVIEKWLTHEGPMVVDFRVVPDICLPMVQVG